MQDGLQLHPVPGSDETAALSEAALSAAPIAEPIDLLNNYAHIFVVAFAVTLIVTPFVRRVATAGGVVDQPDNLRKQHRYPVAYLGGVAVFIGLLAAVATSYLIAPPDDVPGGPVPIAIVIGMVAITFTGLADDVWGWDPRLKIAGQLVAAAALAMEDVGVRVADGMLAPFLGDKDTLILMIGSVPLHNADLFYWIGTALIAIFVLGGCNAANLIDGLDGLLSGVTAIVAVGLLIISLLMAGLLTPASVEAGAGQLASARVILSLALLGAVLGFLPHNFNPATIFLGDSGSLLLGYLCVVIILTFGEQGQTHLVFAGLIVFALPIMDTMLAIIRRKMAGTSMSAADHNHIHHQLKRVLGGVKRTVFALYGITGLFAALGVSLAALTLLTELRVRIIYAIALVLFGFVAVIAVKDARRQQRLAAATGDLNESSESSADAPAPSDNGASRPTTSEVEQHV